MESWDTYWQGPPYWDGYAYGPFAESSGCVSTGSRHVRVANIQSGMMPVMVSSESGSCIQPACSSRTPDPSKNKGSEKCIDLSSPMHSYDECDVAYSVKFINPKKKSMYFVKKWRINRWFQSVTEVQRELKQTFDKDLLQTRDEDIEFGYVKPGHGTKGRQEWIFSDKDLEEMYKEHIGKTEIMFWVYEQQEQEAQQISKKRPRSPSTGDSPTHSKRKSKSDVITHKLMEVETIADKLTEKHEGKFSAEQMNVWAHLINMKKHQSFDDPPDKPFFRGSSKKVFTQKSSDIPNATGVVRQGISPSKRIGLRTELLDQLDKLSALLDKGIIDHSKYEQLHDSIIADIA